MNTDEKLQRLKELSEQIINKKTNLVAIKEIKTLEKELLTTRATPATDRDMVNALKRKYNKEIAYWANANIDIKPFVEGAGYKLVKGESTERWQKYTNGGNQVLLTGNNTIVDVKTGESKNLFAFVNERFTKENPQMSDTSHFVNEIIKHEGLSLFQPAERQAEKGINEKSIIDKDKKEFHLTDYRVDALNTKNSYLNRRGITEKTLESPLFKGSIMQGNRVEREIWQNNVIYPFKQYPEETVTESKALLQQYGAKVNIEGKEVDKIFTPGEGKSSSLWISNAPEQVKHIRIMENPLDCLSHYQLYEPKNSVYAATGGRPAEGQMNAIGNLCKRYKAQPVISFDRDMAGYRFDSAWIARRADGRMELSGNDTKFCVKFRNVSDAGKENLKTAMIKEGISFDIDIHSGAITATTTTPQQLELINDYANKLFCGGAVRIEKSSLKDWNDDLKKGICKPELYETLKISVGNGMKM